MMRRMDVHEAANRRLKIIFDYFDYVYVSFSGGKDSGILLHLCMDYIRMHAPGRKLGVFHMDYEVQYRQSTEYVERMFSNNRDILEVFHCCVPFKVPTCTSMYQQYWRPWQEGYQNIWVRQMPGTALTVKDFDFWNDSLWDYDFQSLFPSWIRRKKGCKRVCCLVGIRTQESFNRWRAIHSDKNYRKLANYKWTHRVGYYTYNTYPIYDWKTTDVWTGYARYGWDYNRLYDLYYQAGIPLSRQRVASPFISQAVSTLHLYKVIDPDTWGRMVSRVNGVSFAGMYGNTVAMGWRSISCPDGFTWKEYMYFLLDTLPRATRENYLEKLRVSQKFWREKGGCLGEETIGKLRAAGVPFTVEECTAYRTDKRPVRMEYIDEIDIPEFREIPTYKRMCVCILKNDHTCKYMGFTQTKAVPVEKIVANSYNPNVVAPPEMKLLELSIWEDGYTMPLVCYYREEEDIYELVDGYHRYLVMKTSVRIYKRENGLLPVTVINKDISNRMASTIRHNRARGMHSLELMTGIVAELSKSGMSDSWIMRNIGMDKNELLRFKQISGLAELFRDRSFGLSDDWLEE